MARARTRPQGAGGRLAGLLLLAATACGQTIPAGKHGVRSLELQGVARVDDAAIKACLATYPRERFGVSLGSEPAPECGRPPFDASRVPIELWAWPWTQWPLFDPSAFERDLDRLERWYRARGYYDARVVATEELRDRDEPVIDLAILVEEGEPVLITRLDVTGLQQLRGSLRDELRAAVELELGDPFDEALYERSKEALLKALQEASYARAQVRGQVEINPDLRLARVHIEVETGPPCRFGRVRVTGQGELPADPIWGAADIQQGAPYSLSAMTDARRAIWALGPFASVELESVLREDSDVVDVLVNVVPGRMLRFGLGVGITAGDRTLSDTTVESEGSATAEWDVHLLGKVEHRNLFGGMRRLRIEERPKLIFPHQFPGISGDPSVPAGDGGNTSGDPTLGNLLLVDFAQPAFGEPRTTLRARARWDLGPDPFRGGFFRSDVVAVLGPERRFFAGRLLLSVRLNLNLFLPDQELRPYPSYQVGYVQYAMQLDMRDDPRHTREGSFFSLDVQHAGLLLPSDWDYVRIIAEMRGYLSLPAGMVLAGRLRAGMLFVTDTQIEAVADDSGGFIERLRTLGPLRQRLRGGGHNSVRGYRPGTLGDVVEFDGRLDSGGLRQWEASLELRAPITADFGAALFVDVGDVTRLSSFRFDHPQTTLGLGLRYHLLVGNLRLDLALAPPALQAVGRDQRIRTNITESELLGFNGALHFTFGEAF